MSKLAPLWTAAVNGRSVRYFRSPLTGPDFPWHAFLDLIAAMGQSDDLQEHFLRMVRNGPFRQDTRVVGTTDGPVIIGPHYMAQGLIGALDELGKAPSDFERAYCQGLSDAIDALTGDLSPIARFNMTMAMARRHLGQGGAA